MGNFLFSSKAKGYAPSSGGKETLHHFRGPTKNKTNRSPYKYNKFSINSQKGN